MKLAVPSLFFLMPLSLASLTPYRGQGAAVAQDQRIQNLRAFAKLYGYVRYFHPSDEASRIDWDRFAIYGCRTVKNAKSTEELRSVLQGLFYPIAPTG